MKNLLSILCAILFLSSCVELPNLLPNGPEDPEDMLIVVLEQELVNLSNQFPDTLKVNDSIEIILTLANPNTECSDIKIGVNNGQILKELGNYKYYSGLNNGSLLGNATLGAWNNSYLITDRFPVPTILCQNDHLIVRNKDVYLGCRLKFSDNQWYYGLIILSVQDFFPVADQILTIRKFGINKTAGVNARIGE
jgi:hypothetical protein